jgi:hypothetical protein
LFGYDPHAPLNCEVLSLTAKDGYSIRDVAYTSPLGGKVPAYLVMPEVAKAPFPAIIFAHSGQGNRASFLPEAESYAAMGVASLLVDAPFVREKGSTCSPNFRRWIITVCCTWDTAMERHGAGSWPGSKRGSKAMSSWRVTAAVLPGMNRARIRSPHSSASICPRSGCIRFSRPSNRWMPSTM